MIKYIKNFIKNTNRDNLGNVYWAITAFIFGIIILPFMIVREIYQYFKYLKPCGIDIEINDIIRYALIIGIFSGFHWFVFEMLSLPWYLYL